MGSTTPISAHPLATTNCGLSGNDLTSNHLKHVPSALNLSPDLMGYAELRPIWKDHPSIPGLKINIGDFIQLALDQC